MTSLDLNYTTNLQVLNNICVQFLNPLNFVHWFFTTSDNLWPLPSLYIPSTHRRTSRLRPPPLLTTLFVIPSNRVLGSNSRDPDFYTGLNLLVLKRFRATKLGPVQGKVRVVTEISTRLKTWQVTRLSLRSSQGWGTFSTGLSWCLSLPRVWVRRRGTCLTSVMSTYFSWL